MTGEELSEVTVEMRDDDVVTMIDPDGNVVEFPVRHQPDHGKSFIAKRIAAGWKITDKSARKEVSK